jgi:hypothetical protein
MSSTRWREILSKSIMREILTQLHQGNHWGPQAVCDAIFRVYVYTGIYSLAKQVMEGCIICRKFNKQALRKQP